MKRSFLYSVFILFLTLVFINSCSEQDNAVNTDKLDFAFITGDCEYVINYYDNIDDTGVTLSQEDAFRYLSALLYCGNFSLTNNADIIANIIDNSSNSIDIYNITSEINGISDASPDELKTLSQYYIKAANICNARENANNLATDDDTTDSDAVNSNTTDSDTVYSDTSDNDTTDEDISPDPSVSLDTSISLICGFAGALGFSTNLSTLLSDILGDEYEIDISKDGFQQALQDIDIDYSLLENITDEELEAYAENFVILLDALQSNSETMDNIISLDSAISDEVNSISEILIDAETNGVTTDTLLEYLLSIRG